MTTFEPTPVVGAWWHEPVPPDWYLYGPTFGPVAPPTCDCGDPLDEDTSQTTGSGDVVCERCADDMTNCGRCGDLVEDTYQTINDSDYCESCRDYRNLSECDHCNRWARSTQRTDSGYDVCRLCAAEHYSVCDGSYCSTLIGRYEDYCDDCASEQETDCECCGTSSGGLINSYSYKPEPIFHGDGPAYLGLELEISTSYRSSVSDAARVAHEHLGDLGYLKDDSSVDSGFEIVTHPMSHAYARESFPWRMLQNLRENGAIAGDNGLHVHVSREAFKDPTHVYRWLKFLHRNSEQVSVIARRRSNEWAAWNFQDRERAKSYAKGDRCGHRYSAVNVQNWATFEVRVFASTLERNELMAALDLVAGSVEYTRDLTVHDIHWNNGWGWNSFRAWCGQRDEYSALRGEMEALCAC